MTVRIKVLKSKVRRVIALIPPMCEQQNHCCSTSRPSKLLLRAHHAPHQTASLWSFLKNEKESGVYECVDILVLASWEHQKVMDKS